MYTSQLIVVSDLVWQHDCEFTGKLLVFWKWGVEKWRWF